MDTGPDGDNDPFRPVARLQIQEDAAISEPAPASETPPSAAWPQRFEGLLTAAPTAIRHLYFSENNPESKFYITVQGQQPRLFHPVNPPAIVTHNGAVEEWTIENRSM